jgi:hypothetical protein
MSGGAAIGVAAVVIALAVAAGAAFWFFVYKRSDYDESAELSGVEPVTLTCTTQSFDNEDDGGYLSEENPMEVPAEFMDGIDDRVFSFGQE